MKQMVASIHQTLTQRESLQHAVYVMLGACLLTCASQICLYVPISCVPFTLQAQAVLMLSAVLGPRYALHSVLAFLCMGACGLPVFAGASGSLLHLMGPRGGYLMSYILVAPIVGTLSARAQGFSSLLGVLVLGNMVTFACGCLWLASFIGLSAAFMTGVVPFVMSDLAKTVLLALAMRVKARG